MSKICKEKKHFILVDMAYQGFATGDLEKDSAGLKLLAKDGHKLALCQSFSKNMGLYGENIMQMNTQLTEFLSPKVKQNSFQRRMAFFF